MISYVIFLILFFFQLSELTERFENIELVKKRFATIWGGTSLLEMLLHCFQELLELPWDWDYVLNLSESDYPIKTLEQLEKYLSSNLVKKANFVKSHGRETDVFIRKQGLDRTFVECDNHLWRIGRRKLPSGIQVKIKSIFVLYNLEVLLFVG